MPKSSPRPKRQGNTMRRARLTLSRLASTRSTTSRGEYETEKRLFEAEQDELDPEGHGDNGGADLSEEKSFVEYLRKAASAGMSQGSNGAIIPKTIASKIITDITTSRLSSRERLSIIPKARCRFRFTVPTHPPILRPETSPQHIRAQSLPR